MADDERDDDESGEKPAELTLEDWKEVFAEQEREIGELKGKLAELEPLATRAAELEASNVEHTHREAFTQWAQARGVKPDLIPDLWKAGAFKGQGDPDPKAIGQHFDRFLEGKPSYLNSSDRPSRLAKDEHGNRGASTVSHDGKHIVTNAQLNDLNWTTDNLALLASGNWTLDPSENS